MGTTEVTASQLVTAGRDRTSRGPLSNVVLPLTCKVARAPPVWPREAVASALFAAHFPGFLRRSLLVLLLWWALSRSLFSAFPLSYLGVPSSKVSVLPKARLRGKPRHISEPQFPFHKMESESASHSPCGQVPALAFRVIQCPFHLVG